MDKITLEVANRETQGSGPAGRLRRRGLVPAVLYGHKGNRLLQVDENRFAKTWHKAGFSSIVTIVDEGGAESSTLIKAVQRNRITDGFVHIDFQEVYSGEMMSARVPVHVHGEATGVKNEGGTLDVPTHEVEVRCFPENLPHQIDIDVTEMHVGDILHLRDLPVIEGVTFQGDPDLPVVAIIGKSTKTESLPEDEAPEAEGAAPDKAEAKE